MKTAAFAILALLVALAASLRTASAESAGIEIGLYKDVYVSDSFVRLSHIAGVTGNIELAERAKQAVVGRTPAGALALEVSAAKVRARLLAAGIGENLFVVKGEATCRVFNANDPAHEGKSTVAGAGAAQASDPAAGGVSGTATQAPAPVRNESSKPSAGVAPKSATTADAAKPATEAEVNVIETVVGEIRRQTAQTLGVDESTISIRSTGPGLGPNGPLNLMPKAGAVVTSVRPSDHKSDLGRRAYVVSCTVNNVEYPNGVLTVSIARLVNVAVLTRKVTMGTAFTTSEVAIERRELTTRGNDFFTSVDELLSKEAARVLNAGEIVKPSDVRPAIVVKRGQTIRVAFGVGRAVASYTGVALQDGAVGQVVRVQPDSKDAKGAKVEPRLARITAAGTGTAANPGEVK